ncbi:MAG: hypothetical protein GY694_16690 [Gammaproteobacteria bacterium]|nr:hypothetical protein [Gammaproteobacteria bacterium]
MKDILFVWLPVIFATLAIIIGLFLLFIGYNLDSQSKLLKNNGIPGSASVTHHYSKETTRNANTKRAGEFKEHQYFIDYELSKNGTRYKTTGILVSKALWDGLSVGSQVDIIYLISNPENSRLAESYTNAGTLGATIQMVAGTVLTLSSLLFIVTGVIGASTASTKTQAGENWISDQGIVFSITKSDDAFVRLMQPETRVVRFIIGDDDGGREMTGQVDLSLAPHELPELKVGDTLGFLRAPNNKDQAVLQ